MFVFFIEFIVFLLIYTAFHNVCPHDIFQIDNNLSDEPIVERIIRDKGLLDEVEHDIKNYSDRGQCYLPKRS
jgi:hypothetical protein